MFTVLPSKKFSKQLRRLNRSGNFDREKLDILLQLLINRRELASTYHDHELKGDMSGFRECHLSGNLIMVYKVNNELERIILYQIGSHSDIFG